MDLRKLTLAQVKRAFKLVGTLATEVTFLKPGEAEFSFESGEVEAKPATATKIRGIPDKKTSKPRENTPQNVETVVLMFISSEVGDPSIYSTATFNGKNWKPVAPFIDDGFTTTITFVKEK